MKKIIITNKDDVIMAIGNNYSLNVPEPDAIFLDGSIYAITGQHLFKDVIVPFGVVPGLYTYDGINFEEHLPAINRIKQEAIDEYTLQLIEGGVL